MAWITKKKLKAEVAKLTNTVNTLMTCNKELADTIVELTEKFPFFMGQVVYDVQLRNDKGKFTKNKASREHSLINEVVVDKKNYFNLVARMQNSDVFTEFDAAQAHLNSVCID